MNNKINIFDYATSELSQDAFICWFLEHLRKKHYNEDIEITKCANEFMKHILERCSVDGIEKYINNEKIYITDIKKQDMKIDVLIAIDDLYIIIEDKTFTSEHDNQINRYKDSLLNRIIYEKEHINTQEKRLLEEEKAYIKNHIKCIYYKTIEEYGQVNADCVIDRKYLLELFEKYLNKTNSEIFLSYYSHLKKLDDEVEEYKTKINWSTKAYYGFFKYLEKSTISKKYAYWWGNVSNLSGGFMCYAIFDEIVKKELQCKLIEKNNLFECLVNNLYIQLENKKISIKLEIKNCVKKDKKGNEIVYFNKDKLSDEQKELIKMFRNNMFNYFNNQLCKIEKTELLSKTKYKLGEYITIGNISYDNLNYKELESKFYMFQNLLLNIVKSENI